MSFGNDEDGDGLAALFGGITPAAAPPDEVSPRRAARLAAEAAQREAAPPEGASAPHDPPAATPQYPGLAASEPPPYQPPAPTAFPPPAPASYSPPPPAAYPPPVAYPPPATSAPTSPAYEMPAPQGSPADDPPAPHDAPAYDLPAPAAPPSASPFGEPPAPRHPESADDEGPVSYDLPPPGAAHPAPIYPPTAQYPAGIDPVPPTPLEEPPSFVAPPPYGEYAPPAGPPDSAPFAERPIGERDVDEHPIVRSEFAVPATIFPPGPLLPSSTPAVETPEDLERSTLAEKVGIVLAVIGGPIGLTLAIVNAARSARRRGWLIGIVRASLVLGVLSSIAAGVGGYVLWNLRLDQMAHAELAAASASFCAAAEADPAMVTPPTLGWPAAGPTVGESITSMQAWTDRWTTLADSSPAKLTTGLELLADAGQTIVDSVTQARVVDDAANQTQIASVAGRSGVAAWYTTYCVAP